MNTASVIGVSMIVALMTLFEWSKMSKNQKKEKVVFAAIALSGWLLAIILIFFPEIPGPTRFIELIFKSQSNWLEQ